MSSNHTVEIRITAANLSTPEFQKVIADLRGVGTAADQMSAHVAQSGGAARKAGGDLKEMSGQATGAAASLRRIGETAAGVAIGNMLQDAPRLMLEFGKASFNAASDFQENMNKVDVVFGKSGDGIERFASDAATNLGLSESAALGAAGTFGNLLTSMGLTQQASADMSQGIVQLAADLGSFNNISTDEALGKLRAGLVGEVEPMRTLGVNLSAAEVQSRALSMGLADTAKQLTAADKAQASYALILEQTTNAQGDFARTSDGAANSIKTLQGRVADLKVEIGEGLTPAVADFSQSLGDGVGDLTVWIGRVKEADAAVAEFASHLGLGGDGSVIGSAFSAGLGKAKEGAESLFYSLVPGAAVVHDLGVVTDVASGALHRFGIGADDAKDSTDESTSALWDWIAATEEAIRVAQGAKPDLPFFQSIVRDIKDARTEIIEFTSDWENMAERGGVGNANVAVTEMNDLLGRQAEAAGRANEANTDYFHSLELGSGAAAEMAFHVAKVVEAQNELASAYQSGLKGMALFNDQSSEYAGIQGTLEKGYDAILKKQEDGRQLTEEEQLLLDRYPTLYGRLEGAQEDATIQAGLFAAANTEVMLAQDELNAAIARGETNLDPYIARLNDAHALVGDQAFADPMTQSLNSLTGTVSTVLVPAILDMTRHIEYISKPWLIEIDAATEAAEAELLRILGLINQINSSTAAPYMPGLNDPGGGSKMAEGGIVSGPTLALIGEDGPELVLPLSKPERMKSLLKQAGIPAWAEGGGVMSGSASRGGIGLSVGIDIVLPEWGDLFEGLPGAADDAGGELSAAFQNYIDGILVDGDYLNDWLTHLPDDMREAAQEIGRHLSDSLGYIESIPPPDWSFLFDGLDATTEDFIAKATDRIADFLTGMNMEDLASGELLADAEDTLASLFNAKAIAEQMGLGDAVLAAIQADIDAAQAEVNAIGAAMGTEIVQGIADALGTGAFNEALANFREDVIGGFNLDDMQGQFDDLNHELSQMLTLQQAALGLGDAETADRLGEVISDLTAQIALLDQVVGTEAVQAWQAWQEEVAAAEEAAERMAAAQERLYESMLTAVEGIAQGGEATGSFFEDLVADAEAAEAALNFGLLLGVPPEVLQQLGEDLSAAEELLNQGTIGLQTALLSGLVDEETLQALAEAGGEWFETLYDQIFGVGALDELEAGWNDITQVSLDQLALLITQMEDGGAGIVDSLVDAVTSGAMSYEEALGLLSDATGAEVNEIIAELEALEAALVVQLAEALLTGSDPSAIEANLAIIDQLLAALADRAVDTATTVSQAFQSMSSGPGGATTILEELENQIRETNEAADEMAGTAIAEQWKAGLLTLEEAEAALAAIGDELDSVGSRASSAATHVSNLTRSLESNIAMSFNFAGSERRWDWYEDTLAELVDRFQQSMVIDPEDFTESFLAGMESLQDRLQTAVLEGEQTAVDRLTRMLEEMVNVAGILGIHIGDELIDGMNMALGTELSAPTAAHDPNWEQGVDGVWSPTQAYMQEINAGVSGKGATPQSDPISSVTQALTDSADIQGRIIAMHVREAFNDLIPLMAREVGLSVERGSERGLLRAM